MCVCLCACTQPHTRTHALEETEGCARVLLYHADSLLYLYFIFVPHADSQRTLARFHWLACVLARTCEGRGAARRGRHRGVVARGLQGSVCVWATNKAASPGEYPEFKEKRGRRERGVGGHGPASRHLRSARWRVWARHSPPSCTPGRWPVLASKCRLCRPG